MLKKHKPNWRHPVFANRLEMRHRFGDQIEGYAESGGFWYSIEERFYARESALREILEKVMRESYD